MIHFILVQNKQGKIRLSRWYSHFTFDEKKQLQEEVFRTITRRSLQQANFVEFRKFKLVYRRYAGLYFSFCVDVNDNVLLYLESIHLMVELLDKFFQQVCELDLVFNFHKSVASVSVPFAFAAGRPTRHTWLLTTGCPPVSSFPPGSQASHDH